MPPKSIKKSPVADKHPDSLRPYFFYGVDLEYGKGEKEATAECPWCGKDKFSVNISNGVWRCLVCGTGTDKGGGNIVTFIRLLWEQSYDNTTSKDYEELAHDRKLEHSDTPLLWCMAKSFITGNWLVPGYNSKQELTGLYEYRQVGDRMALLPGSTMGHRMFGMNLFDKNKPISYICEGIWDAMALWETLRGTKRTEKGLGATSNPNSSLLADANVVGIPAAQVFADKWGALFADNVVYLTGQNDHPGTNPKTGAQIPPASYTGMKRIAGVLQGSKPKPTEIMVLKWGEDWYDPNEKHGYDIRDALNSSGTRIGNLQAIMGNYVPIPSEWQPAKLAGQVLHPTSIDCLPCTSYREMINEWRKAMKWTDGLDSALAVMLASVASTQSVGDQLWVKIIGPASCGKSTLCEALSINEQYIHAMSTLRGFHSGWKGETDEDKSLIALIRNKTLVIKDGDTLLQAPNLSQILAEARDIYDRTSRSHYRNNESKVYTNLNMTFILCGTGSLRAIDSSELGERFLDCVVMEGIEEDFEDEVLNRVARRAERTVGISTDDDPSSQYSPELLEAMRMTGGYVSYLRENAQSLLQDIVMSDQAIHRCTRLGKFVAYMRARPSKKQEEISEREFAARLVSQLVRLSKCLACVMNRKTVDGQVLRRVVKVALDTSRGQVLEICRYLYDAPEGMEPKALGMYTGYTDEATRKLLRFLKRIGAVNVNRKKGPGGARNNHNRWTLSPLLRKLYEEAVGDHE